jgi:alkanesulfonate monooxygenase SsuD/methylene tetrahydromethanopterin reductase-like flavin-dependent oxidoreductase (luciferase family)
MVGLHRSTEDVVRAASVHPLTYTGAVKRTEPSDGGSNVLAPGSLSLRLYPQDLPAVKIVDELRTQAALAEAVGFDGVMTSEHHGGFTGYLPNPIQAAGWALEATSRAWAAPAPLLLPLRHWTHVVEDLAWMSCRFPGRVGAGVACGGLALDFELADLPYDENLERFKSILPAFAGALRGRAEGPISHDPAVAATRDAPIPVISAAQSPGAVRRAAKLGCGVLYDSLQTVERTREISDAYRGAGGTGARVAIRRVWLGAPPREIEEAQMDFYRDYARQGTQKHWGAGQELIHADDGDTLAAKLARFCADAHCDALNLRVHLNGLSPATVREQIERIGAEVLPPLRKQLATLPVVAPAATSDAP